MESNGVERYAVVTGANKGIGFEIVKQLAANGVTVLLTARNVERGVNATLKLHQLGFSKVLWHQLDVSDHISIDCFAYYVNHIFGRLDILVNNAGDSGVFVDEDGLRALKIDPASWLSGMATNTVQGVVKTNYSKAKECLNTNYYGVKNLIKALLMYRVLSPSARIVNVSSLWGELRRIPNERTRNELGDIENLSEEKVDAVLKRFMHDLKEDVLEAKGWPVMLPTYSISKACLNAYTRILARKYPKMLINCVHPGYVDTDLNWHTGTMCVEDGAKGAVKLALLPDGGPTGCYFDQTDVGHF